MAETGVVKGWNISFAAQDSKLVPSVLPTVEGTPGVSGTHLGIWSFPSGAPPSGADVIMLFYQTQGNDITMFSGSVSSGQWHVSTAPIPDRVGPCAGVDVLCLGRQPSRRSTLLVVARHQGMCVLYTYYLKIQHGQETGIGCEVRPA